MGDEGALDVFFARIHSHFDESHIRPLAHHVPAHGSMMLIKHVIRLPEENDLATSSRDAVVTRDPCASILRVHQQLVLGWWVNALVRRIEHQLGGIDAWSKTFGFAEFGYLPSRLRVACVHNPRPEPRRAPAEARA